MVSQATSNAVVVVPAYNESQVIAQTVAGIQKHFDRVVVIDDGSSDDTAAQARSAGAKVVQHPVNLGQGAALQTGFAYAVRDQAIAHIVTFDADGQHRVTDALAMIDVARESGVQVVLGSRFLGTELSMPPSRKAVLRAGVLFTRLTTGLHLTDAHNGLRVLSRDAVSQINLTLNDMAHASQLLNLIAELKLSYVEVPVTIDYTDYSRARGQSNLNALNIVFDLATERLRTPRVRSK